jgi:hypothetical protein
MGDTLDNPKLSNEKLEHQVPLEPLEHMHITSVISKRA